MKSKVKWGVLGTANLHDDPLLRAISSVTNGEVQAISDGDHFDSCEELLNDPSIDIVYIRLPINLYREWTIKAARHKKHVLWEQPGALNAEEAEQVLAACQEHNVTFFESFFCDFHPQHEKVKELIRDQLIGDVKMMRASFSYHPGNEMRHAGYHPKLEEGVLFTLGPYCVNAIRHILGGEPTSVVANGVADHHGVDMTVCGILNYPNNICAVFDCSSEMMMRNEYEVIGTKGRITASFAYRPDLNKGNGILCVQTNTSTFEITINDNQYVRAVEHISDCILTGTERSCPGENTRNNMKVIDAVHKSLKNGCVVSTRQAVTKREDDDWGAECGIAALFCRK